VKPIHKTKGDPTNPKNYRLISLISCLGKTFTGILRNLLESYVQEISLLKETQTGVRKGYSTLENILILQCLSQALIDSRKKLFCAFLDFKQAFDTVRRESLWYKRMNNGVNGKCFNYIENKHKGIKFLIKLDNKTSDFFKCNVGVRQGTIYILFIFSFY
jgi:hypothetical protein